MVRPARKISQRILEFSPFLLLLIVFCAAGSYVDLSAWEILKYLFAQCLMLAVGYTVLMISGYRAKDCLQRLFLSYALGYCCGILLYLFFLMCGIQRFVRFPAMLLGVLGLIYLIVSFGRKKADTVSEETTTGQVLGLLVIILAASILMFFSMEVFNESALLTGYSNIDQDLAYWVHHSLNATKGYPIPDLSSTNSYFYNHYFTNLQIAFLYFVTGIDLYSLSFVFNEYVIVFLIAGSIYSLFREFVSGRLTFLALFILMFCAPAQNKVFLFYIAHIYLGSHGTAEGYAMEMFSFLTFYCFLFHRTTERRWAAVIPILMLGVTLGLKGPNGLVVLFGIGAGCICMLFDKEKRVRGFVSGVLYLLVFFAVLMLFLRGPQLEATLNGTSGHSMFFSTTNTMLRAEFMQELYQRLTDIAGPVIGYLGSFVCYVFLCAITINVFLFTAFIRGLDYLKEHKGREGFSLSQTFLTHFEIVMALLIYAFGFILFIFLSHKQFSQTYFVFAGYPFGLFAAFTVLDKEGVFSFNKKKWLLIIESLSILVGIMPAIGSFRPYIRESVLKMQGIIEEMPLTGSSLTRKEQEGLIWVRDHLETDAVFITNKTFSWSDSYLSSFFTDRQFYVECWGKGNEKTELAEAYFTGVLTEEKELTDKGIDYAILYKNIEEYSSPKFGTLVYNNDDIEVLRINSAGS